MFAVKTGLIYSRRLIEKAIQAEGKCPVSDVDLSADDLVPVNSKLRSWFCLCLSDSDVCAACKQASAVWHLAP